MENLNEGHRERLREKYINGGETALEPHELLEIMLFSVMPVIDTNHIAHELINAAHGDLSEVFYMPYDSAKCVEKIGEAAIEFLHMQGDLFRVYAYKSKYNNQERIVRENVYREMHALFTDKTSIREFYVVFMGIDGKVIEKELIAEGDYSYSDINVQAIIESAISTNAISAILAHNHINGIDIASDYDIRFTKEMKEAFEYIDVELIDHIIVCGDKSISIRNTTIAFKYSSDIKDLTIFGNNIT